jgi:hypothetical protein
LVALNISVYPGDIQVETTALGHIRNTSPTGIDNESSAVKEPAENEDESQ